MMKPEALMPTVFVILGATGDLVAKKIAPALFHLYRKKELPGRFRVVGFSRRELTDENFRVHIDGILSARKDAGTSKERSSFLSMFSFVRGAFQNSHGYANLKASLSAVDAEWGVCTNKLFYLAVPPQFYATILMELAKSGLTDSCSPEEGWTRVIVEKPFGSDAGSARELDKLLSRLFKEEQIYRIDHYTAKEMLQNVLAFRFSNNIFENDWSGRLIERVNIRLLEKIGVEDRGSFYDGVGALRDVGQNHLLQMLSLVTMENPGLLRASSVRAERLKIFNNLRALTSSEVKSCTFRAQYDGYRQIRGVATDSETETYFKIRAYLNLPRWEEVPFYLEAGKRMGEPRKEIEVIFRHPVPCLCEPGKHYKNSLVIQLEPNEGITLRFQSKKPGFRMETEERSLDFLFRAGNKKTQYTEEYEKLLLDCIRGDQTLFLSSAEIEAMWKFIDPIMNGWRRGATPLHRYKPDSPAITEESASFEKNGSRKEDMSTRTMNELGIVGLGKMGAGIARRLNDRGFKVHGFTRSGSATRELAGEGITGAYSLGELVSQLPRPRVIWLMITSKAAPHGKNPVDEVLFENGGLARILGRGDIVIDGGNSFYEETIRRNKKLAKLGVHLIDVGFSGGPAGARNGGCLMVGGDKDIYERLESIFRELSVPDGYGYLGESGAGHFAKMVHNGIEYGMMQALGEGVEVLKKSKFKYDLARLAELYNHGSVIESRLVGWLVSGLKTYGEKLDGISGTVAHTGEGEWTVKTAKELGVSVPVISESFRFRVRSSKKPSYTGKILSVLRNQFGGHST